MSNLYRPFWKTAVYRIKALKYKCSWGLAAPTSTPQFRDLFPQEELYIYKLQYLWEIFWLMCAFSTLILQPITKKRVACESRISCERQFVEVLSVLNFWHYTHHFLLLLHIHQISWSCWHLPKCWKIFSIKAKRVLSLQSSFLLCISVRMRFCSKEDFGFLLLAFAWYCPVLVLPIENVFASQQSGWSRVLNDLINRNI